MFESLDPDREDRTFSPINILSSDINGDGQGFNNKLNSFMDHCWDGHYTCQKRLSRFPGLVEANRYYELYFTGTQPRESRYVLLGTQPGDWLVYKIDFSKSIYYKVYADGSEIEANRYDQTDRRMPPIKRAW
jgi:hypothetical protein